VATVAWCLIGIAVGIFLLTRWRYHESLYCGEYSKAGRAALRDVGGKRELNVFGASLAKINEVLHEDENIIRVAPAGLGAYSVLPTGVLAITDERMLYARKRRLRGGHSARCVRYACMTRITQTIGKGGDHAVVRVETPSGATTFLLPELRDRHQTFLADLCDQVGRFSVAVETTRRGHNAPNV
jgi:hypothetical protein